MILLVLENMTGLCNKEGMPNDIKIKLLLHFAFFGIETWLFAFFFSHQFWSTLFTNQGKLQCAKILC